jgi:hypothetical protein
MMRVHFVSFTCFTVHHSSSVTFFALALVFYSFLHFNNNPAKDRFLRYNNNNFKKIQHFPAPHRACCWVSLAHRIGCPASIMCGVATDTLLPRWDGKYTYCVYGEIGRYILCIYINSKDTCCIYIYIQICLYYCVYIYKYA